MVVTKVPPPKWRGSDNYLLNKYLDFLHYQRDIARSARITELHRQVVDFEKRISAGRSALAKRIGDTATTQMRDRREILDQIHKTQHNLRLTHATLAELLIAPDESFGAVSVQAARQELLLITTGMPGVMGMRFREGLPVIHLRASYVAYGERYDFGDYELLFKETTSPQTSVIQTHITRYPMSSTHGNETLPYWIESNGGWFCFGERATEMRKQFRSCQFGHFVNLAVDSICSLNEDDHYMLGRIATIPTDAVWHNHPRQRPRRRAKPKIDTH